MKSRTTKSFRKHLAALPRHVRKQAEEAYQRWEELESIRQNQESVSTAQNG